MLWLKLELASFDRLGPAAGAALILAASSRPCFSLGTCRQIQTSRGYTFVKSPFYTCKILSSFFRCTHSS